jgi:hypothetical protein
MMKFGYWLPLLTVIAVSPSLAWAKQDARTPPPAVYAELAACRTLTESAARLACFDQATAKLADAVASNNIYMIDRAQVKETRKSLFGLTLPSLGIFGNGDGKGGADSDQISQLDSTITSVRQNIDGWVVTLAEGSVWQQTDSALLGRDPKAGMAVIVKKAALGSFKMNVAGQPAIRVRRIL